MKSRPVLLSKICSSLTLAQKSLLFNISSLEYFYWYCHNKIKYNECDFVKKPIPILKGKAGKQNHKVGEWLGKAQVRSRSEFAGVHVLKHVGCKAEFIHLLSF